MLEFVEIVAESSLIEAANWKLEFNETDSTLVIASAGAADISGEGLLLSLRFAVPDTALGLIEILADSAIFNAGETPVERVSGGVRVIMPLPGDVDLNGRIQAFDASLILKYLVGFLNLSRLQLSNANVTSDTTISALDAALILQNVVGLVDSLPVDTSDVGFIAAGAPNMPTLEVQPGQTVEIPPHLHESENVLSLEGTSTYNPNHIDFFADFEWSESLATFIFEIGEDVGSLSFAGAGSQTFSQLEDLGRLGFVVNEDFEEDETIVNLKSFRLNENEVLEDEAKAVLSRVIVGVSEEPKTSPTEYALLQNYPNPFNPTTSIRYQLPISGLVKIFVYNLTGELIRTLVNAVQPAGFHEIEWDGMSDSRIQVSSGLYVYRINAGDFVQARKMMLVR